MTKRKRSKKASQGPQSSTSTGSSATGKKAEKDKPHWPEASHDFPESWRNMLIIGGVRFGPPKKKS